MTAGLDVRYLRPAPLAEPVSLLAVVTEAGESAMTVDVQLHRDGKPRAAAVALWKRWRLRTGPAARGKALSAPGVTVGSPAWLSAPSSPEPEELSP